MRALTGLVLVVLAAAVLSGCAVHESSGTASSAASPNSGLASASTAPNVYEQQRAAGVTVLLDALGAGLLRGDRAAVAGLLDASAPRTFRDELTVVADNFAGRIVPASATPARVGTPMRLRTFRYQLAPSEEAETLVPPEVQTRLDALGSSDSWVAPVDLHYALGGAATPGIAEPEVVVSAQLVVARYGDSWKVVGDATLAGKPAPPTQLWDLPGLAATDVPTAGGSSLIAAYPDTAAEVANLRGLLPGAVVAVTEFWGTDWAQRAAVVATGRAAEFEALAPGASVGGAAAATVFDRIDTRNQAAIGQRIILTPTARSLPAPALGVVVRHEMTHVAARVNTAVGAPMWITEGVPEYVGRKGTYRRFPDAAPELAEAVIEHGPPAALPADSDFAVAGAGSQLAYQSAWSMAAFVAKRYGEPRLRRLYLGVASTADVARQDAAIITAVGVTRSGLIAQWRRWLDEQVR